MASKRKPVSIDTKVQALDEVAKEYGVPCNTLLTWLKNKLPREKLTDLVHQPGNA